MNFEPKHTRLVAANGFLGDEGWVDLEENVLEGSTEVGTIDVGMAAGFGVIDVFTFAAVELDGLGGRDVGQASREEGVGVTHDARTFAKVSFLVLLELKEMLVKSIG